VRKLTSARGLEIIEQGRKQYMAIFEESANPFKVGTQDVERKLWLKGFLDAKFKWEKANARKKFVAAKFVRRPFVKK
jgi:1,4-alpha-glucan branching enzyme